MLYRLHEWIAEHCRWVQFPRPRYARAQLVGVPSSIDQAFKWMLFLFLMGLIWGPVLLALTAILMALLGHYPVDPPSGS